jgi:hypothetical protein
MAILRVMLSTEMPGRPWAAQAVTKEAGVTDCCMVASPPMGALELGTDTETKTCTKSDEEDERRRAWDLREGREGRERVVRVLRAAAVVAAPRETSAVITEAEAEAAAEAEAEEEAEAEAETVTVT